MKKFFFFAAALVASVSMSAQYAHVNLEGLSQDAATSLEVGTVLATTDGGVVNVPFATTWKVVNAKTDSYGWFYAGENALNSDTLAVQGQDNGKDEDGGNPALTLKDYANGAALGFEATKNGYLTVFHKASSNKQYVVFEEGTAVGYEFAQLAKIGEAPEVICYEVKGVGEFNEVKEPINKVEEIVVKEGLVSKNGESAMRFPVYEGVKYHFGATGSKMTLLGVYFSEEKTDIYVSKAEGEAKLLLLTANGLPEGIENNTVAAKAVKTIVNGQIVIEKNGVKYNVLGAQL